MYSFTTPYIYIYICISVYIYIYICIYSFTTHMFPNQSAL